MAVYAFKKECPLRTDTHTDTTPLDKVSKPNLKIGIVYLRRFLNLKLRAPRVIFFNKKSNFLRKNLNSTTQKNDSHPKTALNQNKTYA